MSGRLDQSLDSIINSNSKAQRDARRRSKPVKTAGKVAAPVGGVEKAKRPMKPAVKVASGAQPKQPKISKIVVSGLPFDVNEAQIKEYFQKAVGSIKKVSLSYDKDGRSRGVADIIFSKPESAKQAAETQNGVRVDGKPMRIEVVVDAKSVPEAAPVKSFTDRVTYAKQQSGKSAPLTRDSANPKAQPKSAANTKATDAKKNGKGKGKPQKKNNAQRPKRKTAEELDAEMTDYFAGGNAANGATVDTNVATNTAAPATGDDMGMEEIS